MLVSFLDIHLPYKTKLQNGDECLYQGGCSKRPQTLFGGIDCTITDLNGKVRLDATTPTRAGYYPGGDNTTNIPIGIIHGRYLASLYMFY